MLILVSSKLFDSLQPDDYVIILSHINDYLIILIITYYVNNFIYDINIPNLYHFKNRFARYMVCNCISLIILLY